MNRKQNAFAIALTGLALGMSGHAALAQNACEKQTSGQQASGELASGQQAGEAMQNNTSVPADGVVVAQNQTYIDVIIRLEASGYEVVEVSRDRLDRVKIEARNQLHMREVVVSGSTGEVMSDVIVTVYNQSDNDQPVDGAVDVNDGGPAAGVDINLGASGGANGGSAGGEQAGDATQNNASVAVDGTVVVQNQAFIDVIARLEASGYEVVEMSRNWLGRVQIEVRNQLHMREVVVSGSTGEVMSDVIVTVYNQSDNDQPVDGAVDANDGGPAVGVGINLDASGNASGGANGAGEGSQQAGDATQNNTSVTVDSAVVAQNQAYIDIMARLEASGYEVVDVSRDRLDRVKIEVRNQLHIRKVVVSGSTGEVMSDVIVTVYNQSNNDQPVEGEEATNDSGLAVGVDINLGGSGNASGGSNSGRAGGSASGGVSISIGN